MRKSEEARLLGMSAEREARLLARIQEKERLVSIMAEALRKAIEKIEDDTPSQAHGYCMNALDEYEKLIGNNENKNTTKTN